MNKYLVQVSNNIGGPLRGPGFLGNPSNPATTITTVITIVIGLMTIIAGIWFIFLLITGGIAWMASGGDKAKLASAQSKIFTGAVGLTIVVAALFLAEIFGGLIGLDQIINPGGALNQIISTPP